MQVQMQIQRQPRWRRVIGFCINLPTLPFRLLKKYRLDQSKTPGRKDLEPPKAIKHRHISHTPNSTIRNGLLQLPGELRNKIYEELIGAWREIHIGFDNKRAISVTYEIRDTKEEGERQRVSEHTLDSCGRDYTYNVGIVRLLRTCRMM
jgi:hypothetical protein